jgi:hypothetical protein
MGSQMGDCRVCLVDRSGHFIGAREIIAPQVAVDNLRQQHFIVVTQKISDIHAILGE